MNKMKCIYVLFVLVISLFYISISICLFGCSSRNPIQNQNPILLSNIEETREQISSTGIFGIYELNIDSDKVTAELVSKRETSIGESLMVNGMSFFTTQPCRDCLSIRSLGLDGNNVVVGFHIKHPMKPGDPSQEPSNKNRLDLDVFDMALLIRPTSMEPIHFTPGDYYVYDGVVSNADAYTRELQNIIDDPAAIPYVLVVDDSETVPSSSTYNEFAMGDERDFNVLFPVRAGENMGFELYLTFAYGVSATLATRLNPVYYNPEFNRKPAWKIEVIPPNGNDPPQLGNTWDDSDDTTTYNVTVKVYDWQVGANVNPLLENLTDIRENSEVLYAGVLIQGMNDSPPYVSGSQSVSGTGTPDDPLIFEIPVANENLLPGGEYKGLVKVADMRSAPKEPSIGWDFIVDSPDGIKLNPYQITEFASYQTFTAYVVSRDFNPVDVTPPWLNFSPQDVFVEGNYAYIAGGVNGLHIFNISDPLYPVWVNWVDTLNSAIGVYVTGGYAYVADGDSGLQIIDVEPIGSASIVKYVPTPGYAWGVYVTGGYAYVADGYSGLQIIDVEPIGSASIVKYVPTPGAAEDVYVSSGYAYIAVWLGGLQIIDIEPIVDASIVKSVDTPGSAIGVYVTNGYAYVADGYNSGLQIIDIEPIVDASIVKSVDTPGSAIGVYVSDGYAFVGDGYSGLQIMDVEPPESASIVKSVDTPGSAGQVCLIDCYAYVGDYNSGLQIIDIEPLESAHIVSSVDAISLTGNIYATSSYAYIAEGYSLRIIDIEPPESAFIVNSVGTQGSGYPASVYVVNGYAYVADYDSGLQIIDVELPESAFIVNSVDTPGRAWDVHVSDGYAYIADDEAGLQIIDAEPPESAFIAKSVATLDNAYAIFVSNGYAYIADFYAGLQIIDVEPLESASIVKSVDITGQAVEVYVSGGYAFVANQNHGLQIIDIEPPESAYIFNSVDTPGSARGVFVSNGYAYIADWQSGLQIIDIQPPESAYIVNSILTPYHAVDVHIMNNYAYIADLDGGLRIIKLW